MTDRNGWTLGQTSKHYETGDRGPGTISTGRHDHGGVSYGSYQLSSHAGTLREYLDHSAYGKEFDGLKPVTPEFDAKWRDLAKADLGFGEDQHNFIKATHYDVQMARLKADGLDLAHRGPAVKDAVWSTSIQFRNKTKAIFARGLEEKFGTRYKLSELSDKDIVEAVQDYKIVHNNDLFRSSPDILRPLKRRAINEKEDLMALAAGQKQYHTLKQDSRGMDVVQLQRDLDHLGYHDANDHALSPDGKFGPGTRHVVETYQHDHGLAVDGKAGPQTQASLHQAATAAPTFPALNQPSHPDHAMFLQALGHVHQMDFQHGRIPDQQSDNIAAALVVSGRRDGLSRIDVVALGTDARKIWGAEHPPGMKDHFMDKLTAVDTVAAARTPVEQSSASWQQAMQQFQNLQQQQAPQSVQDQTQVHVQPGPVLSK